jgi:ERCC4-related helicase
MCGELRVTRKQMIDFVQGIPIPAPLANVPSPPKTAPNKQATLNAVFGASGGGVAAAASPAMTHNPYAKKRPASAMGQNSDSNSHNKSQNQSQMMERPRINEEESEKTRQPPGAGGSLAAKPMVPPNPPLVSAQAPLQPTVSIQNIAASVAAVSNIMPFSLKDPPPEYTTQHPKQPLTSVNTNTNAAPVYHHQQQQTASSATFTNNNNNNNNSRPNSSKFHRPGVLPIAKSKQTVTKQRASDASDNNNNNNNKDSYQYALSRIAYLPGPVPIDPNTAHEWIYPESTDYPTRQYQLEISKTAILHNTLVSLPTGLGKTLIAAVVMYNYHRWFPSGKVIFLAPTLPLVQQQIKACYDIMGIPTRATAILTGKTSQDKRLLLWQEKSVFFCTPQTVQKDLESSTCPAQEVVCVVLDEAHRAAGKYAYVNVINLLEHSGSKFRVLGLSATPGANIKAIQQVIDVLKINRIEARHESELAQYTHTRTSEIIIVPQVAASKGIEAAMNAIIDPLLNGLRQAGCFQRFGTNSSIACYNIMKESEAFKGRTNNDNTSSSMSGYFFASQKFVQIRDFLHKQGVGMVRTKINEMRTTRQMGMLSNIVKSPEFARLWEEVTRATCDPNAYETNARDRLVNNPKLGKLCEILKEHFERARACSKSSRAIVFSQYRDSVSEIVTVLESYKPMIRSRHFVGQGKGSTKQQQQQPNSNESQQQQQQVQGMNQAEQQTVVREFRNDVYNVLVVSKGCESKQSDCVTIGCVKD